jgi:hypothetical protein
MAITQRMKFQVWYLIYVLRYISCTVPDYLNLYMRSSFAMNGIKQEYPGHGRKQFPLFMKQ